jgi:twitching motility protein PilI
MANREALRELQARLASRLQAARSEGMSVAWLAVMAGGQRYLLPLGQAGEIFPLANLQPVPYSKSWFRGVVNVRGSLLGVVGLSDFVATHGIEQDKVSAKAPVAVNNEASVITLNALLDVNCALHVDALSGLRGSDAFTASEPAQAGAPAYFGNRLRDAQGEYWQEINLRALAHSPQFLSISA